MSDIERKIIKQCLIDFVVRVSGEKPDNKLPEEVEVLPAIIEILCDRFKN